jgi:hypothetical protein
MASGGQNKAKGVGCAITTHRAWVLDLHEELFKLLYGFVDRQDAGNGGAETMARKPGKSAKKKPTKAEIEYERNLLAGVVQS